MIHLLVWSLIIDLIGRKVLTLVGVMLLVVVLAMTGIGIVVLLLFGKRMMTMMGGEGCCSRMGSRDEPGGSEGA